MAAEAESERPWGVLLVEGLLGPDGVLPLLSLSIWAKEQGYGRLPRQTKEAAKSVVVASLAGDNRGERRIEAQRQGETRYRYRPSGGL